MKIFILPATLIIAVAMSTAQADLYLEAAFEGGGDTLIPTNTGDEISAGGGLKFAIGIQNPVNDEATASIRLSLGYLFDNIDANNGEADFKTYTFDALYAIQSGPHTFGIGGTMHIEPEYKDNIENLQPLTLQFDDAFGVVFQYGYHFTRGLEFGARLTNIDYEIGNASIDAGSFGIFISNGF